MAGITWITESSIPNITPASSGWQTITASDIASGSKGVIVQFIDSYTTSSGYDWGFQHPDTTENRTELQYYSTQSTFVCGVNTSKQFEVYTEDPTVQKFYLLGYFDDCAVFPNKASLDAVTISTTSAWTDVDISSYLSGSDDACMIFLQVVAAHSTSTYLNFRPKGGSQARTSNWYYGLCCVPVGLDTDNKFQYYNTSASQYAYFLGYLKRGEDDPVVCSFYDSNAVNNVYQLPSSSTDFLAITSPSAMPSGSTGGFFTMQSATFVTKRPGALRDGDSTRNVKATAQGVKQHVTIGSKCSSTQTLDGATTSSSTELKAYLIGYTQPYTAFSGENQDITLTTLSFTVSPVTISSKSDYTKTLTTTVIMANPVLVQLEVDFEDTLTTLSLGLAIIEIGVSYILNQSLQLDALSIAILPTTIGLEVEIPITLTPLSIAVTCPTTCHIFHGIFEDLTCTNEIFSISQRVDETQQGANTIIQETLTQRLITSNQFKERLVGIVQTITAQPDVKQVSRQPAIIQIHRDEEVIETLTEQISVIGVAPCGVRVAVD